MARAVSGAFSIALLGWLADTGDDEGGEAREASSVWAVPVSGSAPHL
jgi:hypothetical protein